MGPKVGKLRKRHDPDATVVNWNDECECCRRSWGYAQGKRRLKWKSEMNEFASRVFGATKE